MTRLDDAQYAAALGEAFRAASHARFVDGVENAGEIGVIAGRNRAYQEVRADQLLDRRDALIAEARAGVSSERAEQISNQYEAVMDALAAINDQWEAGK
ncbi:hypothetical protein LQ938_09635 [Microbacterium sp. cx-55]|uniref:hypothetical protein n=1 Tax=Microbacterium sp. cx-55 TaxID=2875948 RepID=UPI001CBA6D34|nr:hypothetical protein [Microbacterium sp. cx-55]MBZ4485977.1 hypothetical protein [Microbacterium sp. cx-55]UGB34149.1 hypothetical protein LQ938_09635 [Microbacterium sp. cx-55]